MNRVILNARRLSATPRYRLVKRLFDIALVLITAPLTIPILLACALAIRLESQGPILFIQRRAGLGGRPFSMFKFRTMVPNAEALKAELASHNELTWPDFKMADDPRVTRVGRFLRRSSLDELPQLWNVLRGDMSLVGPRPTSFAADTYRLWQTERLEAIPGLTGLWQISGRSDIDFEDRARLDIEYIHNCCFTYDLNILIRTAVTVFRRNGAY